MLSLHPTPPRRQRAPAWPPASRLVQRVGLVRAGDKPTELPCHRPSRPDGNQPSADPTATHAPTLPERPVY